MPAGTRGTGAINKALREELPQTMRVIRLTGDYVNLWGFGDHIYLGIAGSALPDNTPFLLRMSPGGRLETLLTKGQIISIIGNPAFSEIVAIHEAVDGTIFCSTHGAPVHILRKRPTDAGFTSVYNDPTMTTCYGIAINYTGSIFATMRGTIGGAHRSILRSQDGGTTWATMWSDNADWLYCIEAHGGNIVAGGRNIIVRSRNGGATWTTTAVTGDIRSVKCLGGRTDTVDVHQQSAKWVAIGPAGYFYSLDQGATWINPLNFVPFAPVGVPNPASIRPNGEIYVISERSIQFARSRSLCKWDVGGILYMGASSRGIYVTDTHIYISSAIYSPSPFLSKENTGMVWIVPLSTLEWAERKETYTTHAATNLTTDDTDYSSTPIICNTAKRFLLMYDITETGTLVDGDRVVFKVEFSDDAVTWRGYQNGPFGYLAEEESTTPCNKAVSGDCDGEFMRVTLTSDYTNADPTSNYFTVTVKVTATEN